MKCGARHPGMAGASLPPRHAGACRPPRREERLDVRRFDAAKMQKVNLFETGRFFLDVYCLEPGQSQKPHVHPK